MRIIFTLTFFLLCLSDANSIHHAHTTPQFTDKDVSKSKVHVILKDGKSFKGYLVNCDEQYMYIVQDRHDVKNITTPFYGSKMALHEIKEVRYARNPVNRILIGLLTMIVAFFILVSNIGYVDCERNCGNGGMATFSLFLFAFGLGYAISSVAPHKLKLAQVESSLQIKEIKSKSLWRKHLEKKYANLSSKDQYLLLLDQGYIDQKKKVTIKRKNSNSPKLYVVAQDDQYLYASGSLDNLKEALIDSDKANHKLKKESIARIIF